MSARLHARRATGPTGAEREESFTWAESVSRWSPEGRAAYEAERSPAVRFYFLAGARCSNQAGNTCIKRTGIVYFVQKIVFNFFVVLCLAVLSL